MDVLKPARASAPRAATPSRVALAAIGALAVGTSLCVWCVRRAQQETAAQHAQEQATPPAPSAPVATRSAASTRPAPLRAISAAPPPPARREPPADPELSRHLARIAELDTLRAREQRDEAWASSMEDEIGASFAADEIQGSAISLLSCARTLCALHIDHDSREASASFAEHFDGMSPDRGAAYVVHYGNEHSGFQTALYLAREGSKAVELALQRVPE